MKHLFLAGIMQGSHLGDVLHNQSYRTHLKEMLAQHLPGMQVYDPLADHQDSLTYDEHRARSVFFNHLHQCTEVDVVLAFVPEASMGTAVEMWEAYRSGKAVLTISPLKHNWAVRFLSHHVYGDTEEFLAELETGQVARLLADLTGGDVSHADG